MDWLTNRLICRYPREIFCDFCWYSRNCGRSNQPQQWFPDSCNIWVGKKKRYKYCILPKKRPGRYWYKNWNFATSYCFFAFIFLKISFWRHYKIVSDCVEFRRRCHLCWSKRNTGLRDGRKDVHDLLKRCIVEFEKKREIRSPIFNAKNHFAPKKTLLAPLHSPQGVKLTRPSSLQLQQCIDSDGEESNLLRNVANLVPSWQRKKENYDWVDGQSHAQPSIGHAYHCR